LNFVDFQSKVISYLRYSYIHIITIMESDSLRRVATLNPPEPNPSGSILPHK